MRDIEHGREVAVAAMVRAIGARSKVRDAASDMLDAAVASGVVVWTADHRGVVDLLRRIRESIEDDTIDVPDVVRAIEAEIADIIGPSSGGQ